MVDEDVAYVSASSVYRILSDADLFYRWKRSRRSGEKPAEPTVPNERWHTDLMYLRVDDTWYFLVTVLDAYSRYVVHWDLLTTMTAAAVRVVVQDALKKTGANPEVVTDNELFVPPRVFGGEVFRDDNVQVFISINEQGGLSALTGLDIEFPNFDALEDERQVALHIMLGKRAAASLI